jgi:hypothetical protein
MKLCRRSRGRYTSKGQDPRRAYPHDHVPSNVVTQVLGSTATAPRLACVCTYVVLGGYEAQGNGSPGNPDRDLLFTWTSRR